MYTITFYSYKGGVGRTLALAKAAQFLADEGKRVFVLDLDLEAPGLHFKLLGEAAVEALGPGFVEIAHAFVVEDYFPGIDRYAVRVTKTEAGGEIFLMPAGQTFSGDYWKKLAKIHWQELFQVERGDGVPLFLELKEQIHHTFRPDILLIDARTGVTEVGGVALTLLPDAVVCLFSNNEESRWGIREVIRAIPRIPRLPSQAPVGIVPVLTRFPSGEDTEDRIRNEALQYLNTPATGEASPGIEQIFVLHSDRRLEVDERTTVGDDDAGGGVLYRDYVQLFKNGLHVQDVPILEQRALEQEAKWAGTGESAVAKWRELLDRMFQEPAPNLAALIDALGGFEAAYSVHDEYQSAIPYLRRAIEMKDGSTTIRSTAAQYLALALAKLQRFDEISSEILHHAFESDVADQAGLKRIRQLKEAYDTASGRYRVYEPLVTNLARRFEAVGNTIDAEEVMKSGIRYFTAWGDDGVVPLLSIRRERARLLAKLGRLSEAETELGDSINQYRRIGNAESTIREVEEELASVLQAQGRSEAAAAVRRRLRNKRAHPVRPEVQLPEYLPGKRALLARSGAETIAFQVPLRMVTPLLGGAAETREIDDADVIRAPSIRGHLRFWWRALYAGRLSPEDLYLRERRLWGGAADESGGRSTVEVRVLVPSESIGEIDASDVMPYGKYETPGAYALWPARATTRGPNPQPVAHRRKPGTRFSLHVTCNAGDEAEIRATVRAWILFGGYGGRTRRGVGSLTVQGEASDRRLWLLGDATREAIRDLFGRDILEPIPGRPLDDVPLLAGAGLRVGPPVQDAMAAWTTALHWLRDFRQAQPQSGPPGSHDAKYARDRGDNRPGRSNWPEADKVRRLSGQNTNWAHRPRHNRDPVWPRAGFGLPIVAQFQRMDRKTRAVYPPPGEPRDFELRWHDIKKDEPHDRLASPLIVKALPLANGEFVPCALWLFCGYPEHGKVVLEPKDNRSGSSAADFDVLVAPGDSALYAPLDRAKNAPAGTRLRTAFFDWLSAKPSIRQVAR